MPSLDTYSTNIEQAFIIISLLVSAWSIGVICAILSLSSLRWRHWIIPEEYELIYRLGSGTMSLEEDMEKCAIFQDD